MLARFAAGAVATVETHGEPPLTLPRKRGREGVGVVGHRDGLGVGLEAVERRDRPKVFSLVMTMSVVTSVNTAGSKKMPPSAERLPPVTTVAPFLTASAICASTFSTAFISMPSSPKANGGSVAPRSDLG